MGQPASDNPLVGRFDRSTLALVKDLLVNAARVQRVRLVNRIGFDHPINVPDVAFLQLGVLRDQFLEEQVRLLARFRLNPSGLPGLIAMDTTLLFRLVGQMLGESPFEGPAEVFYRALTSADLRMATHVLNDLLGGLEATLPAAAGQRIRIETIGDDPRLDIGLPPSTGMFVATLDIGNPEEPLGTAIIALPTAVVPALWPEQADANRHQRSGQMDRILPLRLDAVVELARLKVPLSKVQKLAVGDVLDLGAVRTVEVRVKGRVAFIAEAGSKDNLRCVRLLKKTGEFS